MTIANGTNGNNPTAPSTFNEIPTIHLSTALPADFTYTPSTPLPPRSVYRKANAEKSAFLQQLRDALLHVGFFYLGSIESFVPVELRDEVVRECWGFFRESGADGGSAYLPRAEKLKIEMKNDRTFLGWSRVDNEITASKPDHREQLDLATPRPVSTPGGEASDGEQYYEYRPPASAPLPQNLWGPNQWPGEEYLPRFREVYTEYMRRMGALSSFMMDMIAESLGVDIAGFDGFFDGRGGSSGGGVDVLSNGSASPLTEEQSRAFGQSHKLKLIKYPDDVDVVAGKERGQGVGPHKDSMLTSYLLQASHHDGLQAQNIAGEWVDCPPREGTLVAAMGQGLEALTSGLCTSTTHRVLSPLAGSGPRYSIPFFQGVSFDAKFEEMNVPDSVRALKEKATGRRDDVEFTFKPGKWKNLGEATLMNRVKSHRDVAERWYPELLQEIVGKEEGGTKTTGNGT